MRRGHLIAAMLTVTLACAAGCTTGAGSGGGADVVVAASLELSGSAADLGTAYQRALELKADQINVSGLLAGRKIVLRIHDNRSDPAVALAQITDFAGDPSVTALVTGACVECETGAAKVVNDRHLPTIALSPLEDTTGPPADRKYIFWLAPNAEDEASVLAGEFTRFDQRKIAFLSSEDAYGKNGSEALARELGKTATKVVAHGQFAPADTDLGPSAHAATAGSPNAVVVWGFPPQAQLAIAAIRATGYHGQVYLDGSAAGDLFLSGPAASTDGTALVFTPTIATDEVIATTPAKAARLQWFQDYTSRYGTYHGHASFAADALQLIANAVARSDSLDGTVLQPLLESSQIDGLSGLVRLTPDNHSGFLPQSLTMLEARGGRWRLLG